MRRRQFLGQLFTAASTAVASNLMPASALAEPTFLDWLSFPSSRHGDDLIGKVRTVLANSEAMVKGIFHGYGLAVHQLIQETEQAYPTIPKRNHPSWPHLHCLCHCISVANMDSHEGPRVSQWGGVSDELSQAWSANVFRIAIYPLIYEDVYSRTTQHPERDLILVMKYLFGDAAVARKAITLIGLNDRDAKKRCVVLKQMIAPLIDACESAWQRSDFLDNAVGRAGGCNCPKKLSGAGKVRWCRTFCTQQGIGSTAEEGAGTSRPWGPYHPVDPGPVPTQHEIMFGELVPKFSSLLDRPHPFYLPPSDFVIPNVRLRETAQTSLTTGKETLSR